MAEVRLTPKAENDLEAIWDYTARLYGAEAASAYLRGYNDVFAKLASFPEMGAVIDGVNPETRSFGHREHRLFYRVGRDGVLVVRILHKAQNSRAFFAPS